MPNSAQYSSCAFCFTSYTDWQRRNEKTLDFVPNGGVNIYLLSSFNCQKEKSRWMLRAFGVWFQHWLGRNGVKYRLPMQVDGGWGEDWFVYFRKASDKDAMNLSSPPSLLVSKLTITKKQGGALRLQGSPGTRGRAKFAKNLRDSRFNKYLSNYTTFSQIHLAGQWH